MKIPGIFVEIKGDFTQLKADMRQANAMVKSQAQGMSNALNNALSPSQIQSGTMGLVRNLGQVQRASKLTGDEFDKLGVDLGELRRHTGLSENEFQKLQSRMLRTRAADATERSLKNIQRQAGLTRLELARLQLAMGDNKGAFNTILQSVGGWRGVAGGIAGVTAGLSAATVGIGYFVKKALDANDAIGKTADYIGISTDALQEYQWAAELTGVSQEELNKGLRRFGRSLGEAAAGKGELVDILDQYNISLTDASGNMRSTEAILNDLANAMMNATSEQERLRIAAAAFGQAGVKMVNTFKGGAEGLEAMRREARELGIVIDEDLIRNSEEANDQLSRLSRVIGGQLKSAVGELAPEITALAQVFLDNRDVFKGWISDATSLAGMLMQVAGAITQLNSMKINPAPFTSLKQLLNIGNMGRDAAQKVIDNLNSSNTFKYEFKEGEIESGVAEGTKRGIEMAAPQKQYSLGDFEPEILTVAKEYRNVSGQMLATLVKIESNYDPNAISSKGAMGLTQLMPSTAKMLGVKDPFNILDNLRGGADYLDQMFEKFNGDFEKAVAAYFTGPGAVEKWGGVPPYAVDYVDKYKSEFRKMGGEYENEVRKRAELEKQTIDEISGYRKNIYGKDTDNYIEELDKRIEFLRQQGVDEKTLTMLKITAIQNHEKEMNEETIRDRERMNERIQEIEGNRFQLERDRINKQFEEYIKNDRNIVEATRWRTAELNRINEEEAASKKRAASAGAGAASSAARSATSTARSHADERSRILEELNLKTIKASGDEYAYKKAMLDKYAADIRAQYAGDKEVLEALDQFYKEKMAEIERSRSGGGFFGEFGEDLKGMVKNMVSDWASGLNDMLWGAETTFDDILNNFGKMITGMLIQKLLIDRIFESSWFTGLFSAQGSVFSSGGHYVPFRHGDVVSRPTLFPFAEGVGMMGEAGPEAIMPLKRLPDGDLGVKAEIGGGGKLEQKIIVHNNAPNTRASATTDSNGNVNVLIEQVEGLIQSRMARGTGLAPAMDARYRKRN